MAEPLAFSSTPKSSSYDAVVTGSGPNGFAAAITLARRGHQVLLIEGKQSIGGGMRSDASLTLPGFVHDICSAVHPLASSSPFFAAQSLEQYGLEWVHPDVPLAHPLDDGTAALLHRSVEATADGLGPRDGKAYHRVFQPLADRAGDLFSELLGPLPFPPRNPFLLARFGRHAARTGTGFAKKTFCGERACALFAGNAAHSILPLERPFTAAVGIMLTLSAHHAGWPFARGGSGRIADALARLFLSLGGEIVCGQPVAHLDELPPARAYLFDTSPRALAGIAGERLPENYRQKLRAYRYGPGVFKLDLAISEPIPWSAADCRRAGTVHLGGPLDEVAASERDCWEDRHSEKPFVLVSQQSLFDSTRTPGEGRHTCWAYCHVPHASDRDMSEPILNQIERFAPGFRDTIVARSTMAPADYEAYNPNDIGGDVIGGVQDLRQMFARPVARLNPYTTPAKDIFLCSASTPPGAGVHGMCGYHAARVALRRRFR